MFLEQIEKGYNVNNRLKKRQERKMSQDMETDNRSVRNGKHIADNEET